ncbi:MAG: redoxin domain-containing protein [Rhodospirillales bacterium]|nr:redoxin domain-containing protein [Rhodospirillales bacterium]
MMSLRTLMPTQLHAACRRLALAALLAAAAFTASLVSPPAAAAPAIGEPAPAFSVKTAAGETRSLTDYAGKIMVLEWTNHECPYVRKHYGSGNMQALQREATGDGVVWLTVISSAPGEQGYVQGPEAKRIAEEAGAGPSEILLDPEGVMGRAYGAKTTPHMYVIDEDGRLVYMGGIDDRPTADPGDIKGARNYIAAALADLAADRPVATASSRPYGCSVKYRS